MSDASRHRPERAAADPAAEAGADPAQEAAAPAEAGASAGPAEAAAPTREGRGARVPREELLALQRPDPWGMGLRIALEWALVVAALVLWAQVGTAWAWVVAWLVIGTRQHALINLIHDGTHYAFSRHRARNDAVIDATCAAPVLLGTAMHRAGHLPHHRFLGEAARDSEKRIWTNLRGARALGFVAFHLAGLSMLRALRNYWTRVGGADDGAPPPDGAAEDAASGSLRAYALRVALAQAAILGLCTALGAPFAYLHLWIYPLFSLALMLVSLLAIAQHQPVAYARRGRDDLAANLDPVITRDAVASPIERFVFANIGGSYHHEHHLFPGVPHTRLPRLHARLREAGYYAAHPEALCPSYAGVLARLVFPDRAPTGGLEAAAD